MDTFVRKKEKKKERKKEREKERKKHKVDNLSRSFPQARGDKAQ